MDYIRRVLFLVNSNHSMHGRSIKKSYFYVNIPSKGLIS